MPARLSSPNVPMCSTTWAMSVSPISRSRSVTSPSGNRASGPPAQVEDDLDHVLLVRERVDGGDDLRRQRRRGARRGRRSTRGERLSGPTPVLLADACRHECRLSDADDGFLHEQRDTGDRIEPRFLESAIDRRLVCPDRGDHALVRSVAGATPGPGRDRAQGVVREIGDVDAGPAEDLQVVRLVLLRDADLGERVELGAVLAAAGGLLDERLDVGEAEDRGEAAARDPPVRALALPVGQPERLEPLDGLRRRRPVEPEQRDRVERDDRPDPAVAGLRVLPRLGQRLRRGRGTGRSPRRSA